MTTLPCIIGVLLLMRSPLIASSAGGEADAVGVGICPGCGVAVAPGSTDVGAPVAVAVVSG